MSFYILVLYEMRVQFSKALIKFSNVKLRHGDYKKVFCSLLIFNSLPSPLSNLSFVEAAVHAVCDSHKKKTSPWRQISLQFCTRSAHAKNYLAQVKSRFIFPRYAVSQYFTAVPRCKLQLQLDCPVSYKIQKVSFTMVFITNISYVYGASATCTTTFPCA